MERHFLFFCSQAYAIPILRPLQAEIERRGGKAAWYLESSCAADALAADDRRLHTREEAREWNPVAVFAPGDYTYDFFPGVKVMVFHGYPINKRSDAHDVHFRIRGWYDIYCTQGPSSTPEFKRLEAKHRSFKVYETGWAKTDALIGAKQRAEAQTTDAPEAKAAGHRPTVFVATTFTQDITQLRNVFPTIRRLAETGEWNWVVTVHPKLNDPELKADIRQLADSCGNVRFLPLTPSPDVMAATDVMLCDSSSIILEYMLLDKPVVTFRNNRPGPQLLNVTQTGDIEQALRQALSRPEPLMTAMRAFIAHHEAHLDGQNCHRILDAVDDFIANYKGKIRKKPLNLFRKFKIRMKYRKEQKLKIPSK
jgi:CDP-glycerol glycerophosphotransferase (TagB/SpsB family)